MQPIHFPQEEAWDIKKIIIVTSIVVVGVAGVMYGTGFLSSAKNKIVTEKPFLPNSEKVAGVATSDPETSSSSTEKGTTTFSSSLQKGVSQTIESIKADVEDLNVTEIATSSPQVQKIIKDIQSLQKYPESQAKEMCQKICSSL